MYISKSMLNAAYPVCLVYIISNTYILKALGTKISFKHRYLHKFILLTLCQGVLVKEIGRNNFQIYFFTTHAFTKNSFGLTLMDFNLIIVCEL